MKTKIKLNDGEELKLEKTREKGSMGQTEIYYYSILNSATREVVGTVEYTESTALKGFKQTHHVTQKDKNGTVIVEESW